VALVSEEIPSADEWNAERAEFVRKAQARKKEEIFASFVAEKRKAVKVTINREILK
jgi:hypothetical protein